MKKHLVVAVGLLVCAVPGFSQAAKNKNSDAEQKVVSAEKQLWEAWKNKDFEPFKQNLSADSVMVDMGGIVYGKDKAVDMLSKTPCEVKSYSLSDTKVDWIDKDTALLTYKADSDATCGGQKSPPSVYASSLWVRKAGKWQAAFHQETPIPQSSNQ
ncbi:MAG TPA: nuclear transport factor 2 family protein [Terriglobales bacterium]|nr:nuclear transport factor 2 family protein [Terriglobales bacterium]